VSANQLSRQRALDEDADRVVEEAERIVFVRRAEAVPLRLGVGDLPRLEPRWFFGTCRAVAAVCTIATNGLPMPAKTRLALGSRSEIPQMSTRGE
jgi:hypothetical protein